MILVIFGAVATVIALVFDLQPVAAYEYPWCAVITVDKGAVYWDCQYSSIEQCRPNVLAGNRGFCNLNPISFRTASRQINVTVSIALARSRRSQSHFNEAALNVCSGSKRDITQTPQRGI